MRTLRQGPHGTSPALTFDTRSPPWGPMCMARRGVYLGVMEGVMEPQSPLCGHGPSLYGVSWVLLRHVMGRAMHGAAVTL